MKRMKLLRLKKGMTAYELGKSVDLDSQVIYNYESDLVKKSRIYESTKRLEAIADALEWDGEISELLEDVDIEMSEVKK